MIISHELKFIFVHNPKCGGTSVRAALRKYHTGNLPWGEVRQHPALGPLDYSHIPLKILRDYFPEQYDLFQNFRSYVVVRNPIDRFISSLSQRMRILGVTTADERANQSYAQHATEVIQRLDTAKEYLDHDIIHFTCQSAFVELDGAPVVDVIVPLQKIDHLLVDLFAHTSGNVDETIRREAETLVYRSGFLSTFLKSSKPALRSVSRIFPNDLKQVGRNALYVSPAEIEWKKLPHDIKKFVIEYYADDFRLYDSACSAASEVKKNVR